MRDALTTEVRNYHDGAVEVLVKTSGGETIATLAVAYEGHNDTHESYALTTSKRVKNRLAAEGDRQYPTFSARAREHAWVPLPEAVSQ